MSLRTPATIATVALLFAACEPLPGTGTSGSSGGSSSSSGSSGTSSDAGAATASGLVPIDAAKLCSRLVDECSQLLTKADCLRNFGIVRVSASCNTAIATSTCDQLSSNTGPVATCFPPCTGTIGKCNGDGTLTQCNESGSSRVVDCQASCLADGFAQWSGTCGNTFQGATSATDQCWCQ